LASNAGAAGASAPDRFPRSSWAAAVLTPEARVTAAIAAVTAMVVDVRMS
jgi:hypothetical protein